MYTFVLVVDSANHLFTAEKIAERVGNPNVEADGRSVVESPNGPRDGWIAVSAFNSEGYDYPEENYEILKAAIATAQMDKPLPFLIEGRDTNTSLANDLLTSLDVNTKTIIDNDHGIIAELPVFKKLAEMGIDWLHQESLPHFD
ncbi:hypothetical protein [Lysobacter enzymogenes]|uniref:hypothetical protein n=1 Tax=Lysobacter enzymogenes TaxID=69 RepID=UPI0019D269CF|nr:hypothetical protein [Lysobacter enzymogenes]